MWNEISADTSATPGFTNGFGDLITIGLHGIKDRVQVDEMNKCVAGSWPHDKVQG